MKEFSVKHDTFSLERIYNTSPARVFAAWADPESKANWFAKAEPSLSPPINSIEAELG